jgi:cell division protein FtsI/penicillin-binding protein 2
MRKDAEGEQLEKHLAAAFYPRYGYGYSRSQAYRQAATQGSIFKLVTAYEALIQRYEHLKKIGGSLDLLNPLHIEDRVRRTGKEMVVGYLDDGKPITRHYKGGRMPRSINANIGSLDIVKAIEMSSNPYFALLAGDVLDDPNNLADAAALFSYGSKTGIDLQGEVAGNIPNDLETNRTGLYSFAIGQHTLVVTPLQTSVMLSAIANGGKVVKPKLIHMLVGKDPKRGKELVSDNCYFPYQVALASVGVDFPLFIAADAEKQQSLVTPIPPEVRREVFMPDEVRKVLMDGMCRVVTRTQGDSLSSLTRLYRSCPEAITDYQQLKAQLIGKTSTAEIVETIDLDHDNGANIYTHVWFGGISYECDVTDPHEHRFLFSDAEGKAELVVVVYLKYGGYGKEAAPVAAQVAKKWKEIKSRKG